MEEAVIYSDGGCWPNPGGPGGWGAFIKIGKANIELYGGERSTTNNRMELMAAIKGLQYFTEPHIITLYTDSQYVQKGITNWSKKWIKKNWLTASNTPVKNVDLWKILINEYERHNTTVRWVRGHSGNYGNEKADALASKGANAFR